MADIYKIVWREPSITANVHKIRASDLVELRDNCDLVGAYPTGTLIIRSASDYTIDSVGSSFSNVISFGDDVWNDNKFLEDTNHGIPLYYFGANSYVLKPILSDAYQLSPLNIPWFYTGGSTYSYNASRLVFSTPYSNLPTNAKYAWTQDHDGQHFLRLQWNSSVEIVLQDDYLNYYQKKWDEIHSSYFHVNYIPNSDRAGKPVVDSVYSNMQLGNMMRIRGSIPGGTKLMSVSSTNPYQGYNGNWSSTSFRPNNPNSDSQNYMRVLRARNHFCNSRFTSVDSTYLPNETVYTLAIDLYKQAFKVFSVKENSYIYPNAASVSILYTTANVVYDMFVSSIDWDVDGLGNLSYTIGMPSYPAIHILEGTLDGKLKITSFDTKGGNFKSRTITGFPYNRLSLCQTANVPMGNSASEMFGEYGLLKLLVGVGNNAYIVPHPNYTLAGNKTYGFALGGESNELTGSDEIFQRVNSWPTDLWGHRMTLLTDRVGIKMPDGTVKVKEHIYTQRWSQYNVDPEVNPYPTSNLPRDNNHTVRRFTNIFKYTGPQVTISQSTWTDQEIVPDLTRVKAVHWNEIKGAIVKRCGELGLTTNFPTSRWPIADEMPKVKKLHIQDLRDHLDKIYNYLKTKGLL